jgi:hypothetical protein
VILLSTPTSLLSLVTGGPERVTVTASWVDAMGQGASAVINPDSANTNVSSAATTTIVPSPPVTTPLTERNVKHVVISNTDPTQSVVVAVESYDGATTSYEHPPTTLPAGAALIYEDGRGWYLRIGGADVVLALSGLAGMSISAGTSAANLSSLVFGNVNGLSFGLSGSTLTGSVQFNVSAGTTSNLLSALTFGNANGVSFGLNASTVTASFAGQTVSAFSQNADFLTNFAASQAVLSIQRLSLPMALRATQLVMLADFRGTAASSDGVTLSHAIYTLSGGTAGLASSGSRGLSWAASAYSSVSGTRYRSVGVSYSMTPGDYLCAWMVSTANGAVVRPFGRMAANIVGVFDGVETTAFLDGSSVSSANGLPATIAATNTNYARTGFFPLLQPGAIFLGT